MFSVPGLLRVPHRMGDRSDDFQDSLHQSYFESLLCCCFWLVGYLSGVSCGIATYLLPVLSSIVFVIVWCILAAFGNLQCGFTLVFQNFLSVVEDLLLMVEYVSNHDL